MSYRPVLLAASLLSCATGCRDGDAPTLRAQNGDVSVTADLKGVLHKKWGDIIRARLTFEGVSRTLKSADLGCVSLQVGASSSDRLYVDSYMDYSTAGWEASEGTVSANVYWAMKNFKNAATADLHGALLKINDKPAPYICFEFDER